MTFQLQDLAKKLIDLSPFPIFFDIQEDSMMLFTTVDSVDKVKEFQDACSIPFITNEKNQFLGAKDTCLVRLDVKH